MASQQTGFRPGSKTDWRKHLTSITHYIDDLESFLGQANSALAPQPPAPGSAGDRAISPDSLPNPHPEDVWCEVKDKLVAVADLFNLYYSLEFYDKPVSLRKETVVGAMRILDDCIDNLDPLFQK